jgi:hypothetical protein
MHGCSPQATGGRSYDVALKADKFVLACTARRSVVRAEESQSARLNPAGSGIQASVAICGTIGSLLALFASV